MSDSQLSLSLESMRASEAWLRPLLRELVDDATASDVLQQTWLRVWQQPPRAETSLRSWLRTVATRLALTHRREARRRQLHEAAVEPRAPSDSTLATVERLAVQRAVSAAVSDLPEPYRTAVLLRHYHQLDVATVAARTGTTAANVRQRLHRGMEAMRERLARDLGEDWRRSPAVLAFVVPRLRDAALAPAVSGLPLLIAMNKIRLALVAALLLAVVGGAMLAPQLFAPEPDAPARPAGTVAAAPPQPAGSTGTAVHDKDRTAVEGAAEARTTAAVQGVVLDTKGRPAAGVSVGVAAEGGAFESLAVSDGNGRFAVPDPWPARGVVVEAPWCELAVRPPDPKSGRSAPLLVVAPCRRQTIAVLDERGWPLAGTTAAVNWYGLVDFPQVLDDAIESLPRTSSADEKGRHVWRRLPLASTFVLLRKPGCVPVTVAIDESTPADLVVTMRAIARGKRLVTGVVTDARGAFAAGARVGLGQWTTKSGPSGDYVLELEAGAVIDASLSLYAAHEGWYPAVVAGFGERLKAPADSVAQDLQLQQRSLAIAGRVVDPRGAPIAGAAVYPWKLAQLTDRETAEDIAAPAAGDPLSLAGNHVRAFGRTDAEGRFTVAGLGRSSYRLRVYDSQGGWAWTTPPIEAGTGNALLALPAEPTGPVAGTLVTRDGGPAAGVTVAAHVTVFATEGGTSSAGLQVGAKTDADGRFRIARMPRLGVRLSFTGSGWINQDLALDEVPGPESLRLVMLRRCHVRVELANPAWATGSIRFLDANDEVLSIVEERGNTTMIRQVWDLHEGKTEVLAVSESAVVLAVSSADGQREERIPVALRAGDVQVVR
ncbi:MAG TPA: sigma-70 family RNA polymerase sigma factor [Planctomycetota bacterium]